MGGSKGSKLGGPSFKRTLGRMPQRKEKDQKDQQKLDIQLTLLMMI